MIESLDFHYDGEYSVDMNVVNVNSSSGLFEEFFFSPRTIHEQEVANRDTPYFLKVKDEPISFSMTLYFDIDINEDKFRRVKNWLYQYNYKPLIFSSQPNKIFYAMIEGDSTLRHNGLNEGYININIRCNSPYAYTPEYISENIEFTNKTVGSDILINEETFVQSELKNIEIVDGKAQIKRIETWGDLINNATKWGEIL